MSLSFSDLTNRLFRQFARKSASTTMHAHRAQLSVTALEDRLVPSVTVYSRDFNPSTSATLAPGVTAAWSNTTKPSTPSGESFLGEFGNQTVTFNLNNIPAHNQLTVEFDLYVIRSWDGNDPTWGGPNGDRWSFAAGGTTLLDTTFRNPRTLPSNNSTQEFGGQGVTGPGPFAPGTGAAAINTLGYTFDGGTGTQPLDAIYHFSYPISHAGQSLTLAFTGSGLQGLSDESWGLDNVTVTADTVPVVSVEGADTFEGAATGGFSFTRTGDLSAPLTVNYAVSGTATPTTDYTALGTTVTFAANQDRVELPVEAFGDNLADDGETVVVTIDENPAVYLIATGAGAATVNIADQPLTISVIALSDGAEGGSNPVFRFLRSGDLSQTLTVPYSVGGTATSGTDFATMAGSVTFNANDDHVDVTVVLENDTDAEPTETITVTLDEPPDADEDGNPDYALGNDSDTVFVKDNDTNRVTWRGGYGSEGQQTDWNEPDNWSTHAVPTASDDVYFDGDVANTFACLNVGSSLSTPLYGMHVINGFSKLLVLDKALTVGTYEQTSGLLNQPSARDLTVTAVMLWSGGTLDATASGASVNIDGAIGRLDPPDTGSMATSATLRIVNNADVTVLPGVLNFAGGNGIFLNAEMKYTVGDSTTAEIKKDTGNDTVIDIASGGEFVVVNYLPRTLDTFTTAVPIKNAGTLTIKGGIRFIVNGQVDGNGPSIKQTDGVFQLWSTSAVEAKFGVTMTGGGLTAWGVIEKDADGNFVPDWNVAEIRGDFAFEGGLLGFGGISQTYLRIKGNVTWSGGTYVPRVWKNAGGMISDRWIATGTFTVTNGGNAKKISPFLPAEAIEQGDTTTVIAGLKGVDGPAPTFDPTSLSDTYEMILENGMPTGREGKLRRK